MRKLGFSLFSCIALVVFMGLSGTAPAALINPSCDLDNPAVGDGVPGPYNNDPVIHDFTIDTLDSSLEYAVSGVEGSGLACGSEIYTGYFDGTCPGQGTLYDRVVIAEPPGVEHNPVPGPGLEAGDFVGWAHFDLLGWFRPPIGLSCFAQRGEDQYAGLYITDPAAPGVGCPDNARACYEWITGSVGVSAIGWIWIEEVGGGATTLSIGSARNFVGSPLPVVGVTGFDLHLCAYAGDAYSSACGDSSQPFLQKNGRGVPEDLPRKCWLGRGIYTVTATMRNGYTTPAVTTCVPWRGPPMSVGPLPIIPKP